MNKTYRVASLWGAIRNSHSAKILEEHPNLKFKQMMIDYLNDIGGIVTVPNELNIVE